MKVQLPLMVVASLACVCTAASEIYKWTDDSGRVHYSNAAPEGSKSVATTVDVGVKAISELDRKQAEARLAKDRAYLRKAIPPTASTPLPAVSPSSTRPSTRTNPTCEEAWKAYDESYACFDRYRMSEGRVKQEAFQHCEQVNQPPETCR